MSIITATIQDINNEIPKELYNYISLILASYKLFSIPENAKRPAKQLYKGMTTVPIYEELQQYEVEIHECLLQNICPSNIPKQLLNKISNELNTVIDYRVVEAITEILVSRLFNLQDPNIDLLADLKTLTSLYKVLTENYTSDFVVNAFKMANEQSQHLAISTTQVANIIKNITQCTPPDLRKIDKWRLKPYKEKTRHILASRLAKKPTKKSIVIMPGSSGRDMELFLKYGVADQETEWLTIERFSNEFNLFIDNFNFLPFYTRINYHNDNLENVQLDRNLDFAWFDLCGNLSYGEMMNLKNNLDYRIKTDDIIFTFSLHARNGFIKELKDFLSEWMDRNDRKPLSDTFWELIPTPPDIQLLEDSDFYFYNKLENYSRATGELWIVHHFVLRYMFLQYSFFSDVTLYKDPNPETKQWRTVPMFIYHLSRFRNKQVPKEEIHLIQDIMDEFLQAYPHYKA